LITKVRECQTWDTRVNKLERTSKTTMGDASFDARMGKELNLWEPVAYPVLGLILIRPLFAFSSE
jgi:hypothetical protein